MSTARTGTLHAADRANGGVTFAVNRAVSTPGARLYRYTGPYNPFTLADKIYENDQALLERLKDAGFTIHAETV